MRICRYLEYDSKGFQWEHINQAIGFYDCNSFKCYYDRDGNEIKKQTWKGIYSGIIRHEYYL